MYRTLVLTLTLIACGDKADDTALPAEYSWPGGVFQFSSTAVDDECLDGGFVPLFLPEGEGTTSDWDHTIEIPSWEDMETGSTYTIDLQEPFTAMEITVTQGDADGQAVLTGAQQTGVAFDEDNYPGCTVDMGIDALILLDGPDNVHGFATLSIDSADGEFCPEFAYPCDVTLDFTGLTAE